MREIVTMGDTAPEDYPKIKDGLFCFSTRPADLEEVNKEYEEIQEKIADFEKQVGEDAD